MPEEGTDIRKMEMLCKPKGIICKASSGLAMGASHISGLMYTDYIVWEQSSIITVKTSSSCLSEYSADPA